MNLKEKEQSLKLAEFYFRDNNYEFTQAILNKVIKIDPNNSKANELLSYIHRDLGQFDKSFELLEVACNQNDCSPEALYYLGSAQLKKGFFDQTIESLKKSMSRGGEFFEALHDLATAQAHIGDFPSALNNYQKCLKFGATRYELFYNIARIYDELKRYDEAIAHYDKAISLKPDYAALWTNKGFTLNTLKRYDEAIAHYDKAISLKPDHAELWTNKGFTLDTLKRYDEAIAHYDKAISLKSNIKWVQGDLLHSKMKICSWSGLDDCYDRLSKKITENEKVVRPFGLLTLTDDALLNQKSSELYVQDNYQYNSVLGPIPKRSIKEKIRIGYFSSDFRNHPVSSLTAELFELHDKKRIEIIAFSFGADDKSPMRLRLSQSFNQFIDVRAKSDKEIAQLTRDLGIVIAVDLGGHTKDSRTGIFSYRAAPIQISYIGYLGTMGAEYYDYLLADKTIIPDELQKFYSEKITYLPSYQVNDRKRTISERQFTRGELGLPETGFVFCCFNNNYKILPSTFDSWMRILNVVEGSVLFLYADNEWAKANLIDEASLRGVDSARLVFGEHIPVELYLARYQACDLFLDTFPYNAGTTASDSLWVGLPLLTLMGRSFASRVAASLLNAIGLPELITNTQEEYEALAIELAMNSKKLETIKLKLANNRLTAPLFNTPLFTKNLESAYIKMYERYHTGLEPDHITIA